MLYHIQVTQVDKCIKENIFNREKYWIEFYNNMLDKKLVNQTLGGEGAYLNEEQKLLHKKNCETFKGSNNCNAKPIISINLLTNEKLVFSNGTDCRIHFGIKRSTFLSGMIKSNRSWKNNIFAYTEEQMSNILKYKNSIVPYGFKSSEISTYCLDILTKEIIKFKNKLECAKHMKICYQTLRLYIKEQKIYDNKIFYCSKTAPNISEYTKIDEIASNRVFNIPIKITNTKTGETFICKSVSDIKNKIGIHASQYSRTVDTEKLYKNLYKIERINMQKPTK